MRAARDSFAERGYAGASLRDIAERAGITHAGLLHHFRSKDDLLAEVLAQRDTEEWEEGVAEVDSLEALAPYLGNLLVRHQKTPELMRLWLELAAAASRPDHPAHGYFVDRYERSRTHVTLRLRELEAQGSCARASIRTARRPSSRPCWAACRASGCSISASTSSNPSTASSTSSS